MSSLYPLKDRNTTFEKKDKLMRQLVLAIKNKATMIKLYGENGEKFGEILPEDFLEIVYFGGEYTHVPATVRGDVDYIIITDIVDIGFTTW